ncbi:TPA: acyltransferase [Serratia marcescens]|uniref:acyltransferase family protein n=1 Tax=Serratia ureilytica TaxID=300181 RepID=UPI0018A7B854|nr:acyltransferase [Serratia ureilytica]MBF4185868.1 acyltransferase [Serratia ureilytica]MBF8440264.1 acyltransferase [Serratia ureilytica]MBF8444716.1 acyltransferase [Serratia ureilytica]HEI8505450.1 acyltransferase [Serratia marcescens]
MMKSNKLTAIQIMRGVAVLLVLFFHSTENFVAKNLNGPVFNAGQSGVDLFFIISGFIIFYSAKNKVGYPGAISFMKSRLLRIVPNYWFYTFVFATLLILFPDKFDRSTFEVTHFVYSLLFIPMKDNIPPLVSLGWTLNYEMYFYIVFFFSIVLLSKLRFIFVSVLILFVYLSSYSMELNDFYKNDVVFEFLLGAILYLYYSKGYHHSFKMPWYAFCVILILLICVMSVADTNLRFVNFGIPCFFIIFLSLHVNFNEGSILEKIGGSSYSIYLSHAISMPFIIKVLMVLGLNFYLSVGLSIVFCLFVGWVAYQVLERRVLDPSWWNSKEVIQFFISLRK